MWIHFMNYLGIAIILNGIVMLIDQQLLRRLTFKIARGQYPPKFMIAQPNHIDMQQNVECAGYSSAYLLRHFGKEASGQEMYKNMPNKMKVGMVYLREA
ncbi:hypothetical protein [Cellulosilyticum ruminicola]|uniref:hypothetical protein n=1 Tax=Cellulosilyticum ruminicola TaxID=425254 RepID=UPI0012ECE978|nr:hypothetical protein [Cellulosilyticum ruminicola]